MKLVCPKDNEDCINYKIYHKNIIKERRCSDCPLTQEEYTNKILPGRTKC